MVSHTTCILQKAVHFKFRVGVEMGISAKYYNNMHGRCDHAGAMLAMNMFDIVLF